MGDISDISNRVRDIAGQRFGKLLALGHAGSNRSGRALWVCRCDCGKQSTAIGKLLRNGTTKSCGCGRGKQFKKYSTTLRAKQLPEYAVWMNMKERCRNPKNDNYKYYGARGITVCARWGSFTNFLLDIGFRPSGQHQLDRSDVNGNYEPSNCRWVTVAENASNKRPYHTKTSIAWLKRFDLAPVALVDWLRV